MICSGKIKNINVNKKNFDLHFQDILNEWIMRIVSHNQTCNCQKNLLFLIILFVLEVKIAGSCFLWQIYDCENRLPSSNEFKTVLKFLSSLIGCKNSMKCLTRLSIKITSISLIAFVPINFHEMEWLWSALMSWWLAFWLVLKICFVLLKKHWIYIH